MSFPLPLVSSVDTEHNATVFPELPKVKASVQLGNLGLHEGHEVHKKKELLEITQGCDGFVSLILENHAVLLTHKEPTKTEQGCSLLMLCVSPVSFRP